MPRALRNREGEDMNARPTTWPPDRGFRRGLLSAVIPCFNEAAVLPLLRERLTASLDGVGMPWEVVFVDDGSRDETFQLLAAMNAADHRFKVIRFSRNFGHQIAVAAGLAHTFGEVVAVLDADLQDPPELLAECLRLWREGDQVVYCVRERRKEGLLLRALYAGFYRLLGVLSNVPIPFDSGDFCLMDRSVVDVVVSMREQRPFMRGMRAWAGFRQRALHYNRPARAAGDTKYPFHKLFRLAADGIFSSTLIPLKLATWLGVATATAGLLWGVFVVVWRVFGFRFMGHTANDLPGWAGVIVLAAGFGGLQLMFLGILGEYVGRIYEETKGRPRWVVRGSVGFDETGSSADGPVSVDPSEMTSTRVES
jgi:polyisoprenyl-phosphate glycosyltransferase